MFSFIDSFLNRITMYRLTLYFLIFLLGVAVVFSSIKLLPYDPLDIALNGFIAIIVCFIANYIFAKLFHAVTNVESVFITALILVLIIPVKYPVNVPFLIAASGLAMATKYLLTIEKQHIFNPAAISVAMISLLSPEHSATWWIGTPLMMPFVLFGGLLLMRKIKRETLVFTFLVTYLFIIAISSFIHRGSLINIISSWQSSILYTAIFFFTFVMLTEPITSPATEKFQQYYSIITAFLFATPQLRLFSFALTPEIALCLGNVFSYVVSPKYRFNLPLKWKIEVAKDTFMFGFDHQGSFNFIPGQYLEWTLSLI